MQKFLVVGDKDVISKLKVSVFIDTSTDELYVMIADLQHLLGMSDEAITIIPKGHHSKDYPTLAVGWS